MPQPDRITVLKTSKLYIGGRFVRTESGRVWPAKTPAGDQVANACWASRKDLREAVRAARGAQKGRPMPPARAFLYHRQDFPVDPLNLASHLGLHRHRSESGSGRPVEGAVGVGVTVAPE